MFDIIQLILWGIIGMVNLCLPVPVSKPSYFLVWMLVFFYFAYRVFLPAFV
jgi:hypothetical protein